MKTAVYQITRTNPVADLVHLCRRTPDWYALLQSGRNISLYLFAVGICSWVLTFAFAFPDIDNGLGQVEFAAAGILQMYHGTDRLAQRIVSTAFAAH